MNRSTVANRWNSELIEANHQRWRDDPDSVDSTWQAFFEGFELALAGAGRPAEAGAEGGGEAQAAVTRLIDAYREVGHYLADLDPLGLAPVTDNGALDLASFGLTEAELDRTFFTKLFDPPRATLRDLLAALRETYCRTIGVEYMHIRNSEIREWLRSRMESTRNRPGLDLRQKRRIILKLNAAELFETFLHTHYVGAKRFSLEGGRDADPAPRRDHRAVGEARGQARSSWGCPTGAGSTSWPTPWTSRTG